MKLNEKQAYAYSRILAGANVFITGPGGVGKSVLINKLREEYDHETIFLASTGVAAQNIKGSTIHRMFQFSLGFLTREQRRKISDKVKSLFSGGSGDNIKRIVIDEISTVRCDLLAAIDMQLRVAKKTLKPFGGIQIVLVGDFYQLSPIVKRNTTEANLLFSEFKSMYSFDTQSWREAELETIQLDQVMRQTDEVFIAALNSIRTRDKDYIKSLEFLNSKGLEDKEDGEHIYLCATNRSAEVVNSYYFDELEGKTSTYRGFASPGFKDLPVPYCIELKLGCRVMICANDKSGAYYNGQTGHVHALEQNLIFVDLDDEGGIVAIEKNTWEEYDYVKVDGIIVKKVMATYVQFPIKLGYAITVHKSQGLSLASAVIHTEGRCFAHGQAYVALSRLRSLDGLIMLEGLKSTEVIVDPTVDKFYRELAVRDASGMN